MYTLFIIPIWYYNFILILNNTPKNPSSNFISSTRHFLHSYTSSFLFKVYSTRQSISMLMSQLLICII
ncbi:hypothetical protein JHK86_053525 [Glycine max]|nr:hypothetical protein JHK86_053525 [Glycine max]